MKNLTLILSLVAACFVYVGANESKCKLMKANVPEEWSKMVPSCVDRMKNQVQMEIGASITYFAMGAYFAQDTVNRPGFAEFFFKSASEEREHAIKLIEYLLMRGKLTSNLTALIAVDNSLKPERTTWINGVDALTDALKLETKVTNSIRAIMEECEEPKKSTDKTNDFHLVDYLTTEFLEEQYRGQRDLAGKISTLGKMRATNKELGEFLFDKKLLNGEV